MFVCRTVLRQKPLNEGVAETGMKPLAFKETLPTERLSSTDEQMEADQGRVDVVFLNAGTRTIRRGLLTVV